MVERAVTPVQSVQFACVCGREWAQRVAHYDIVMCHCGGFVWALQPKRNGPLAGYIWPGDKTKIRNSRAV